MSPPASITRAELTRLAPEAAEKMGSHDRVLLIGRQLHVAEFSGTSVNLLLAQYWGDHIVLVVIGIFAPATYAVAKMIANEKIEEAPPRDYRSGEHGVAGSCVPVQITLIETLIERQSGSDGADRDHRKLAPNKIRVIDSRLWEGIDSTWKPRGR